MSQKPIALVWGDGQSRRCHKPTAKEFEKLIDERRAYIEGLRLAKPLVSFKTTDLWDCILLEMVDYHFERGVETPYELAEHEMLRRQAEHTIRARFGINPRYLIESLDRDARDLVRFIEASWADELWIP